MLTHFSYVYCVCVHVKTAEYKLVNIQLHRRTFARQDLYINISDYLHYKSVICFSRIAIIKRRFHQKKKKITFLRSAVTKSIIFVIYYSKMLCLLTILESRSSFFHKCSHSFLSVVLWVKKCDKVHTEVVLYTEFCFSAHIHNAGT